VIGYSSAFSFFQEMDATALARSGPLVQSSHPHAGLNGNNQQPTSSKRGPLRVTVAVDFIHVLK
jgi:hypothetical protein